ncbi:MAG: ATP-binding cassette domain-containing protein [Promethearchaeota archaeon]
MDVLTGLTAGNVRLVNSLNGKVILDIQKATFNSGMLYGVVGKNLSGRSALLRLFGGGYLPGFLRMDSGYLTVRMDNYEKPLPLKTNKHSAYIGPNPFDSLSALSCTVQEELDLHEKMSVTLSELKTREDVAKLIRRFRLDSILKRNPMQVSGGQAAAVALVSSALINRSILCVDEILAHLDIELKPIAWKLLRRLAGHGRMVFVADNQYDLMAGYADKIISLADGHIHDTGDPRNIFNNSVVVSGLTIPTSGRLALDLGASTARLPIVYTELCRFVLKLIHDAKENSRQLTEQVPVISDEENRAATAINPSENTLATESVTFCYPHTQGQAALKQCTVVLPGGSSVALVGPNGAGKSTLCKILNGILSASEGQFMLSGTPIFPDESPGRYISYAFQNPNDQLFLTTVKDELAFGPKNLGLAESEVRDAVAFALELFHLTDLADSHPLDLPFALRKRVAMAAAVSMRRPWTILDEPTLGQDPSYCNDLLQIKETILKKGGGLIVISHDPEFVFECCDHFIFLSNGMCVWQGNRNNFATVALKDQMNFSNIPLRLTKDLSLPHTCSTRSALATYLHPW